MAWSRSTRRNPRALRRDGRHPLGPISSPTATSVPFRGRVCFPTVVAYNSLQTMARDDRYAEAVREAARVLQALGHFCICVAHPMTDVDA